MAQGRTEIVSMKSWQKPECTAALLSDFFSQDDLHRLALDAGILLECPLLVLNDAFHVEASYSPIGFSDAVFEATVRNGDITYEAGAIISRSPTLSAGCGDYVDLTDSPYRRRFAPLISAGIRLGYFICVDMDGHLSDVPDTLYSSIEQILAKQLYVEVSRQSKPLETAENILVKLLDGGFTTAAHFELQAANTYLASFNPYAFALIDLTTYHSAYAGERHLKEEIEAQFPGSHPFLYKGCVFLFLLHINSYRRLFSLSEEFQLKVLVSDPIDTLFELPQMYHIAREALDLMLDPRFAGASVCTVQSFRVSLLIKKLSGCENLIMPKLRALDAHDQKRETLYCETLYYYLICNRSLKKTCDALFTHRNTVLYRIRRMQEDFSIFLDEPSWHIPLLLGSAMILFKRKGPGFFLQNTDTRD